MSATDNDSRFMRQAIALGRRGLGRTSPNPPVGAVIVRDGMVIGRGYHHGAGLPHAEVEALRDAGKRARGATLYVTLEPCAHHGRTPPCTEAVIAAGIRRVVVGTRDPNPKVPGNGINLLKAAGIEVACGVEQTACDQLIAAFRKHVVEGLPLVTLKLAATLDGRIATASGDSKWITNPTSRRQAHRLRSEHDAILVGTETILHDDPQLTCRLRGGRNPLRVILDGRLRIPLEAQVVTSARQTPTLVLTARSASSDKAKRLSALGVEVISMPSKDGKIRLRRAMRRLGKRNVASVLIEGGATVATAALREGIVDRLRLFFAPKLIGGDGRPLVGPLGVRRLRQALQLGRLQVKQFAGDLFVATEVVKA
ncbi:MAG: bifunctional diaminohydroxyphosphoribosylaminopyrimidine deaminase/5-amino-6-(5-phosphoribosylamino)uracil reductase RibD [Deltaproteobacteria bacterium]|nr:bifunctional diaminohydroxyphosphoribosylaminopyrimidine deaminase/5-amino-6-(5-phosphoribosylamino)uracil reductase RibD [Deltaproteobacteria bacterium]